MPPRKTGLWVGIGIVVFLTGGFLLLLFVIGLWWFSGPEAKPGSDPEVALPRNEPIADSLPSQPSPPPDPRIEKVQPNVEKGVSFLKAKVPELANMRAGYAGLNGLALLECGVPSDDPAILRIAEIIRKAAPRMNMIYDLAPSMFFLNCWNERQPLTVEDRKMARTLVLRIIAGQVSSGIWSYDGVIMTPQAEADLLTKLEQDGYKPKRAAVAALSMSNTQFAMLAVWGSRNLGIPVRQPLLALAAYFHANQNADGSWNYPNLSLKATSTCAGLIALAIEEALQMENEIGSKLLPPERTGKRADRTKAFRFVAKTIGRKKGDPGGGTSFGYGGAFFDADAWGDLYFLWTLERVGVIYSMEQIDGKNWYDWGYPIVVAEQQPDGSWNEKHYGSFGPLIHTPLALLFLTRANIAKDLTKLLLKPKGIE